MTRAEMQIWLLRQPPETRREIFVAADVAVSQHPTDEIKTVGHQVAVHVAFVQLQMIVLGALPAIHAMRRREAA